MTTSPLISYRFADGQAHNDDGSYPAVVQGCTPQAVATSDERWGTLSSALEFAQSGSTISIPATDRLRAAGQFAAELRILPRSGAEARMNLLEGQAIPFALMLLQSGTGYVLSGSVNTAAGWQAISAEGAPVPLDDWSTVAIAFTGDDLVLLLNGAVAARRVLQRPDLVPVGAADFRVGTWVDGQRNQYVGLIAGLRIWDSLPDELLPQIAQAEAAGQGAIASKYLDLGGAGGWLGQPTSAETSVSDEQSTNRPDLTATVGAILARHPLAATALRSAQLGSVTITPAAAGTRDTLASALRAAAPASVPDTMLSQLNDTLLRDQLEISMIPGIIDVLQPFLRGRVRHYTGGAIYWSADTGAREVHGLILAHYRELGGPGGLLGFPRTDEMQARQAGARTSRFENGAIYWSAASGAHEVHGAIYAHYMALVGEKGFLGLPTSDELAVPGGRKSTFQGGTIYWSADSGACEVHGMILGHYEALGGPGSVLGFPISDESDVRNRANQPTGGKLSNFQGGTIYWSAASGAFELHGQIREYYQQIGGPLSDLGYPITDESPLPASDIRYNDFQNGVIVWQPARGALAYTELQLYLGQVRSGEIDDGIDWFSKDRSAELIVYTTVRANGATLDNGTRRPGGHAGDSYNIDTRYTIRPVRHDTTIALSIKVEDWDQISSNDYLGTLDKALDIRTRWGFDNGANGIFGNQSLTSKGGDAPNLGSVRFDFAIQRPPRLEPNKHFREQCWWRFDNLSTPELSRNFFANTFTDVEIVGDNVWESVILNPLDAAFYELAYKKVAASGNCFGMCVEAMYARAGRSLFTLPLSEYQAQGDAIDATDSNLPSYIHDTINRKHGYQVGADVIGWSLGRLATLDVIRPLAVYSRVRACLARGEQVLMSMMSISQGSGHAVLAYRCQDGAAGQPSRIYVADPNLPFRRQAGDASFIEVFPDNTFRFQGAGLTYQSDHILDGLLPGTLMMDVPYNVLASQPRTPIWEILLGLAFLTGGLLLLAGDAQTTQISAGERQFYRQQNGQRAAVANGIPGMVRVPSFDLGPRIGPIINVPIGTIFNQAPPPAPELYAQRGRLPESVTLDVQGLRDGSYTQYFRTAQNTIVVESPVAASASDTLAIDRTRQSRPQFAISTTQAEKLVQLRYGVTLDERGRDRRAFSLGLQAASGATARAGLEPRGASLMVAPAGTVRPFTVTLETLDGGAVRRSELTVTPSGATEALRIQPLDMVSPHGDMVVERLTGVDGSVVERLTLSQRQL